MFSISNVPMSETLIKNLYFPKTYSYRCLNSIIYSNYDMGKQHVKASVAAQQRLRKQQRPVFCSCDWTVSLMSSVIFNEI